MQAVVIARPVLQQQGCWPRLSRGVVFAPMSGESSDDNEGDAGVSGKAAKAERRQRRAAAAGGDGNESDGGDGDAASESTTNSALRKSVARSDDGEPWSAARVERQVRELLAKRGARAIDRTKQIKQLRMLFIILFVLR